MTPSLSAIRLDNTDWFPADLRTRLEAHEEAFQATGVSRAAQGHVLVPRARSGPTGRQQRPERHCLPLHPGSRAGARSPAGGCEFSRAAATPIGLSFLPATATSSPPKNAPTSVASSPRFGVTAMPRAGRENRLCFALVHPRHWGSGCRDLLGIYGGESVYSTWGREGAIVDKLRTIGRPAVVHFRLNPKLIKTSPDHRLGKQQCGLGTSASTRRCFTTGAKEERLSMYRRPIFLKLRTGRREMIRRISVT